MKRHVKQLGIIGCTAVALAAGTGGSGAGAAGPSQAPPTFSNPTEITNPYLPFSENPRTKARGVEGGKRIRSEKELLNRTERFEVDGQTVRAAVVRDLGYQNGNLHERALDFYAQADDGTVFYLGEDVNYYNPAGDVVGHHGSFRYGEDTDVLGVAMLAEPSEGDHYMIENVPGQGSEKNRVASTDAEIEVPAGKFKHALRVEGTVLPEDERELKWYARGVGVLAEQAPDGIVELVKP
jgi:hypothetical protein